MARFKVAAIVTQYVRGSHADAIVGKILEGVHHGGPSDEMPDVKLTSLVEHKPHPDGSIGEFLSTQSQPFNYYKHVEGTTNFNQLVQNAISMETNQIKVDGVLLICEHGDYAKNATGQKQYPKKEFFEAVFAAFGNLHVGPQPYVRPVYNCKHLAVSTAHAATIYDKAITQMKIPLMGGSVLPLSWRDNPIVFPVNAAITDAVQLGVGDLESQGFHALEALQSMMEMREGGESGVRTVRFFEGTSMWTNYASAGGSPDDVLEKAVLNIDDTQGKTFAEAKAIIAADSANGILLIEYGRGSNTAKGTMIMANGWVQPTVFYDGVELRNVEVCLPFAAKIDGDPEIYQTKFCLQLADPYGQFTHLLNALSFFIRRKKPCFSTKRSFLTTCLLDAMMTLRAGGTYDLTEVRKIKYQPTFWPSAVDKMPRRVRRDHEIPHT